MNTTASLQHRAEGDDHTDTASHQPARTEETWLPGRKLHQRLSQHEIRDSNQLPTLFATMSYRGDWPHQGCLKRSRCAVACRLRWLDRQARCTALFGVIYLAAVFSLLLPGVSGDATCAATGPPGFKVVCAMGGAYVETSGGPAFRKCSRKRCQPYPEAPGTVSVVPSFPSFLRYAAAD